MKKTSFLSVIHAAHSLSLAMQEGRNADKKSLETLGIDQKLSRRFKR